MMRLPRTVTPLARFRLWRLVVWGAILGLWQVTSATGVVASYILPAPTAVIATVANRWSDIVAQSLITFQEIGLGLGLALAISVPLALIFLWSDLLRRVFYPLAVVAQSAPKEALAPLFIIWFGFSTLPKVLLAALIAFFPILVQTLVGLERFDTRLRLLALSMGASPLRTFLSFRAWSALPSFFGGLRVGVIYAAVGAVIGEFLGSDNGIGNRVLLAARQLDGPVMYAYITALVVVLLSMVGVVDILERRLLRGAAGGRAFPAW